MKTRNIFTIIAFLLITNIFSQSNLSEYKYVVVPRKYDFLKEVDKYQLNSLTKFLLKKENFNVLFHDDNFPEDLAKDRCLGLFLNVLSEGSIFRTKLTAELRDCNNKVLFTSNEGVSKDKDYKKAYHEALRDAFQSFKTINYKYQAKAVVQKLVDTKPIQAPTTEKMIIKKAPKGQDIVKQQVQKPVVKQTTSSKTLYAQSTDSGFQVVDSTPKVIMLLLNTPKQNVFIVKGQDAIVYEENGFWYLAKSDKSAETLNIKF